MSQFNPIHIFKTHYRGGSYVCVRKMRLSGSSLGQFTAYPDWVYVTFLRLSRWMLVNL